MKNLPPEIQAAWRISCARNTIQMAGELSRTLTTGSADDSIECQCRIQSLVESAVALLDSAENLLMQPRVPPIPDNAVNSGQHQISRNARNNN